MIRKTKNITYVLKSHQDPFDRDIDVRRQMLLDVIGQRERVGWLVLDYEVEETFMIDWQYTHLALKTTQIFLGRARIKTDMAEKVKKMFANREQTIDISKNSLH